MFISNQRNKTYPQCIILNHMNNRQHSTRKNLKQQKLLHTGTPLWKTTGRNLIYLNSVPTSWLSNTTNVCIPETNHCTHTPECMYKQGYGTIVQNCKTWNGCNVNQQWRYTSEILQGEFQTTAIKPISHLKESNEFQFPVHLKVMFTLYCSLLIVQ